MELFSLLAKLTLDAKEYEKELNEAQREADSFQSPEDQTLDLDASGFTSGIADAEISGGNFQKSMEGVFGKIKTALTVSGIVGAIAGVVKGIKDAVDMTAQTADGIDKGADRLSISRRKYQEWDHALRQSGSNINDLQKGVVQFNNYLASFEAGAVVKNAQEALEGAGGDMAQAFARLGISVKDANGNLKTTEDLLEESLIALAGFKDKGGSDAERGLLVTQLFGRGGTGLNNLLDQGVDGVKDLLSEADKLGLIMSDDEIKTAVEYGDAVENLNAELDAIKTAFVADILPILRDATKWLTDFLNQFNPRNNLNSIDEVFREIDTKTLKASRDIDEASTSAKKLIEDLQNMGDYWSLDEQGRMTWDALAAKALELFPQLSEYIDKDGKKISGNTQEIEKNIDAWARLEKQRLLSEAMDEKKTAVARQLTVAYEKGADAAVKFDEAEGKRAHAIEEVNAALKENNMELLDADATYEEFLAARSALYNKFSAGGTGSYANIKAASYLELGSDYDKTMKDAEKLSTEAEKLITEAETAQSNLTNYEKRLSEQMGLTKSSVQKSEEAVESYIQTINQVPDEKVTKFITMYEEEHAQGMAIGGTVPYDNYPALLHRGEKVLTATEVRRAENASLDLSALRTEITGAIREGMADAQVLAIVTDREVGQGANRFNGKEIDAGRYRP